MTEIPTREILWNLSPLPNSIAMYALLGLALTILSSGLLRRAELWSSGKADDDHLGGYFARFMALFDRGALQQGVVREWGPAVFHTLIYVGFMVLLFTTTMVFLHHDLGINVYQGNFYLVVTLASDLFGFGLIIGLALAAHRRWIVKADVTHRRLSESIMLTSLLLLCVQGFILEGLRIHVTQDPWRHWSPIGLLFAKFFWALSSDGARALHFVTWWFHTITVFAFIAVIPYTKFFHIIASSANLFFQGRSRPVGALRSPGDIEKIMESGEEVSFGLGTIKDYSWKQLLDLDACTSCGRCQDVCPAYNSGKILSPKWLILDTRNHMLGLHARGKLGTESLLPDPMRRIDAALTGSLTLAAGGVTATAEGFSGSGEYRANNPGTQSSSRVLGGSADALIAGDVIDPNVFWSCNTCNACVEVCPVGINHVDQVVENRRNMVLMRGEIPSEAQATLRKLENQGNPFGDPNDRIKWFNDLEVPVLKPGDSVDYLYWVGCLSAFDPRKQKIARALVQIMRQAGLSFGVLGKEESCSGDPARRLGEENLFQTLAKRNIATLQNVRFKYLVANCPHCFNTIKNEYPQFGGIQPDGETAKVIHHTQLLKKLLADNTITISEQAKQSYTFHDPCYLGRYNEEYDAPRETLQKATSLKIVEMEKSREKGMCCGAGGGHFWFDMKVGTRVNVLRADQAAATGADNVATGCPFCLQMMEDGMKLTGRDSTMQVRDIAEVLYEAMSAEGANRSVEGDAASKGH